MQTCAGGSAKPSSERRTPALTELNRWWHETEGNFSDVSQQCASSFGILRCNRPGSVATGIDAMTDIAVVPEILRWAGARSDNRAKIPDACFGLGLTSVPPHEILSRVRARLVLGSGA